jgi:hypothetical protein
MANNVGNDQFLDQTRLEQVFESVLCGNLLRLANEVDDLAYIVHWRFGFHKVTRAPDGKKPRPD